MLRALEKQRAMARLNIAVAEDGHTPGTDFSNTLLAPLWDVAGNERQRNELGTAVGMNREPRELREKALTRISRINTNSEIPFATISVIRVNKSLFLPFRVVRVVRGFNCGFWDEGFGFIPLTNIPLTIPGS